MDRNISALVLWIKRITMWTRKT